MLRSLIQFPPGRRLGGGGRGPPLRAMVWCPRLPLSNGRAAKNVPPRTILPPVRPRRTARKGASHHGGCLVPGVDDPAAHVDPSEQDTADDEEDDQRDDRRPVG